MFICVAFPVTTAGLPLSLRSILNDTFFVGIVGAVLDFVTGLSLLLSEHLPSLVVPLTLRANSSETVGFFFGTAGGPSGLVAGLEESVVVSLSSNFPNFFVESGRG